ncbi:phosphotransferase [Alkaliphilus pronyensis]|uniref:Phosphotransferase n=1 Tax=Alkaliphilus pronyensis TaxID=1482732 RepID=A0A6I0FA50_9FIRM|nr:phosphotransferase [Alkaliphilus pronyensis]KAB3539025.1 phosphotransferase [Alkaliphilus pronyensis]
MMKLENLICNTEDIAYEILQSWQHDIDSLRFWRGSSNYVYFFTCNDNEYWLRFTKKDENSLEEIKAEIQLLLYLNNNGYPCVVPIKSKNNNYVEAIERHKETYYAVVFNKAVGVNLDIKNITKTQLEGWGKALASFHSLSMSFQPKEYVRKSWKDKLKLTADILKDFPNEKNALEELYRIKEWLSSLPITNENYGLIHYDFELDNIFWNEEFKKFTIIDFDDSMYHWYAMDIAYALRDLYELEECKKKEGLQVFLKGYCSVKTIKEEYIELLPKFKRFGDLITFAKLLRSLKDSDFSQEPVWLDKLRPKLLNKCQELRDGFIEEW